MNTAIICRNPQGKIQFERHTDLERRLGNIALEAVDRKISLHELYTRSGEFEVELAHKYPEVLDSELSDLLLKDALAEFHLLHDPFTKRDYTINPTRLKRYSDCLLGKEQAIFIREHGNKGYAVTYLKYQDPNGENTLKVEEVSSSLT